MKKTRMVIFINPAQKKDRISMPKSIAILKEMDADDDDVFIMSIHGLLLSKTR